MSGVRPPSRDRTVGSQKTQSPGTSRVASGPTSRTRPMPPTPGTTGLFHVALLYPDRASLAQAVKAVLAAGIRLDGASDHGVSEAIYLRDPDGNGVELYVDRPEAEWPRKPDGSLAMFTRRLDLAALLAAG